MPHETGRYENYSKPKYSSIKTPTSRNYTILKLWKYCFYFAHSTGMRRLASDCEHGSEANIVSSQQYRRGKGAKYLYSIYQSQMNFSNFSKTVDRTVKGRAYQYCSF